MQRRTRGVQIGVVLVVLGCSSVAGDYFWVDSLPPPRNEDGCLIAEGDLLGIRVWGQESMSVRTRVRDDGMITVPFLNDVPAVGQEPEVLARRLQVRLKDFIVNPVVTITLEEPAPIKVSVVGEVVKPGTYQLEERGPGVLHALAAAGGMTPFADGDRIFVLRYRHWADRPRQPARIRFRFDRLTRGEGRGAAFVLRAGDVIVVE